MMNFWTPTFESWGNGFNAADMPWYVLYDYVETFTYNSETNGFDFHWRDDFNFLDTNRWHVNDNTTFDANSTTFRATQVYSDSGHLVLKMEPDVAHNPRLGKLELHPIQVEPVRSEPVAEHTPSKGKISRKVDEHYDVYMEQHRSHMDHEAQQHHEQHFMPDIGRDPSYPYWMDIRGYEREAEALYNPYVHQEVGGTEPFSAHIEQPVVLQVKPPTPLQVKPIVPRHLDQPV